MTDEERAAGELEVSRQGESEATRAMLLAYILLGRTEAKKAAYQAAAVATVKFTQAGAPHSAASYAAAARWMLAHNWHKSKA